MRPLVERLTIGSCVGKSGSRFAKDSAGTEESATKIVPPRSSYIEIGCYPHVLDCQSQSQDQFNGQRQQDAHSEELKRQILQQARPGQDLFLKFLLRKQSKEPERKPFAIDSP